MSANLAIPKHPRIVGEKMESARTWLPRGLGTIVFLWYALAAAPGFYWLDSAELSAGAVSMGSPHATGFPLYMLMAKLASFLPVGELAFRINLLSAACAGFAVGGVSRLILRLGKDDEPTIVGALAGGTALAVSLLFARQGTVAEVYAPTAALIVLTLLLFERVAQGAPARVGLTLAWVAGLGLGMHGSYRLLLGLPILALLSLRLYRGARWPLLAPPVTLLSALGLYLYLPVRSATGRIASVDWGHADTLGRTWSHANASEVRLAFADRMMSGEGDVVSQDLRIFASQIGNHLGLLCVLAALVGMGLLLRERKTRWIACTLAVMALLDGLYGGWINPMGLVDFQNGVPLFMTACVCAGIAVAALARVSGPAARYVGCVAFVALVLPPALVTIPTLGGVADLPRDLSEEAFRTTRANAVLITQSDSLSAGTLYLSAVEGARPDVALVVLPMLGDRERVATELRRSGSKEFVTPSAPEQVFEAIAKTRRPVFWERGALPVPANSSLRQGALVSELTEGEASGGSIHESLKRLQIVFDHPGRRDRVARRILAAALTNLGRSALQGGESEFARELFEAAIEIRPEHSSARVNLGILYSRAGDIEAAAEVTERALRDEPNRHNALVNAARYRLALGDLEVAETHASRALRVSPSEASAWMIAGLVDVQQARLPRARLRLQEALKLSPGHPEASAAFRSLAPN